MDYVQVLGIMKGSEGCRFILETFHECPLCAWLLSTDVTENETAPWPHNACGERYTQIIS